MDYCWLQHPKIDQSDKCGRQRRANERRRKAMPCRWNGRPRTGQRREESKSDSVSGIQAQSLPLLLQTKPMRYYAVRSVVGGGVVGCQEIMTRWSLRIPPGTKELEYRIKGRYDTMRCWKGRWRVERWVKIMDYIRQRQWWVC